MPLDLSALRDALAALDRSLGYLHSDFAKDVGLREQFRAASIQAFEFTYEVAFKMLKRQLEAMAGTPSAVDEMTFMQVVRAGAEAGLVLDVGRFQDYRGKRNITSHTYDQAKAEEIVAVLRDFASDVRFLLAELERRNLND
ncbi:MAG TPA: HI0074 family nucleotidyltransferase substrate-binding subunit [Vicinamibacterales bacterium]|nr:HI0074 family nucleotidyltransferase substrate-binding subunit [Vicinamibacterales bacterium]